MNGYAWSDDIGWLSLGCWNTDTCGTSNYGLTIGSDGTISGYAWADNIGWVSANSSDLTGCPTTPCTATVDSSGNLKGWLKALTANQSQSGGWDGFISLSGTSPAYGPVVSAGNFSGYAWGDMNVGWLDFGNASTTFQACASTQDNSCLDTNRSQHVDAQCAITVDTCNTHGTGWYCSNSNGICNPPVPPSSNLSACGAPCPHRLRESRDRVLERLQRDLVFRDRHQWRLVEHDSRY
jgi:hypothetical protein